jgi:hypothetical protein
MSNNLIEAKISIEFTYEELKGIMYSINRSDAMEVLSKTNQWYNPIAIGLISGKYKIEEAVKELVEIDKQY